MNREIKFRAWDKVTESMIDVELIEWSRASMYKERFPVYIRGVFINHLAEHMKGRIFQEYQTDSESIGSVRLLEFTGIKDCDGKEIFDGDLLEDYKKDITFVCFQRGAWTIIDKADYKKKEWFGNTLVDFSDNRKVIGNIYENPDLIK